MNELITVTTNANQEPVVSCRELHSRLEITERYSSWFNRMLHYGFVEGEDYLGCKVFNALARQELDDHMVKIDMAKEICMIQRNEKGREFRQYFIEVEKEFNSPERIMARALLLADKKINTLELTIKEQRPKVLFAESVEASKCSILIGDLAKLIKQNGFDIGQNRLFEWLRKNGYLISRKGESYNMPTQRAMDLELFEVKERTHLNPDGSVRLTKTTKVTGKGQVYFINKFLQN
ncbi:phage antirepressor KilAC domain-containing protein [Peptostreptococcus anaerobius]|uniref:phage antirepressor KilAC domain-containing protein n=1 Tax=Peptostreptococcus anaerobius TaxID=1261 RepID=UPI002904F1A4|nr:phage antirepressor KilAC domain-containing protein [Peptostreptococcus anaerobius]MDU1599121.1 phage antirepressor KilAC domain-containing protein [Peptostreptococcus anaerobius]MDU1663927.1 phage antirepressor KilAC domain-containing protein [Peptoniphilus harei]MDU1682206.1 phage antirepressor KilAC domain-containing protein [Peptostreptococcus anaerobius]